MSTCHSVIPLKVIFIFFPNQRLLAATERKRVEKSIGFHTVFHVNQRNGKKLPIDMAVLSGRHSQFLRFVVRRDILAYAENL